MIQELLGHSSIKVTEGYTHVASKLTRDATERMGKRLFGTPGTPLILAYVRFCLVGRAGLEPATEGL